MQSDVGRADHAGRFTSQNRAIFFLMSASMAVVAAADQDVRLDADTAELTDRVLGGLGLHLSGGLQVRHQRDVQVEDVLLARVAAHLADGLQERQRLDVADRAADLDDGAVRALGGAADGGFDLVGDVRDHSAPSCRDSRRGAPC
jgi:hypothetical protein